MENTSKALLIAAAVLIVILLIAFGMKIFNSTSDVSGEATETGTQLSNQTTQAASSASDALSGLSGWTGTYSIEEYNKNVTMYRNNFNNTKSDVCRRFYAGEINGDEANKIVDQAYETFKNNIQKESSKFGVTVKFGEYYDWLDITERYLIRNEQGVIIKVESITTPRF